MVKLGILSLLLTNLFFTSAIKADDYYVSYYLYIKKFKVLNEKLRFTKAMVPFKKEGNTVCKISSSSHDLKSFFKESKDDILSCLFKEGVFINSFGIYSDMISKKEMIILKILPTPIQVIFNNGLVTIKKIH